MKFKKAIRTYCKKCNKATEHKVSLVKKGQPSSLTKGSKYRVAKRGKSTGTGNLGKLSKGALSTWKRYGIKSSKKNSLKLECIVCKKSLIKNLPRAKKLELI